MGIHLFFSVSNRVEHRLFSSLSLQGMMELYLTAALGRSRQIQRRSGRVSRVGWPFWEIQSDPCRRSVVLISPIYCKWVHCASKGAADKQTLARPLIANDRLFVECFPSGSKCSHVKTGSISRRAAVSWHSHRCTGKQSQFIQDLSQLQSASWWKIHSQAKTPDKTPESR